MSAPKPRYYGHGRDAEPIMVNGITYRATIPTIRDRDTHTDLADAVSNEARDAIVAALAEMESLAIARLELVVDLSESLASIADHLKEHDAGTFDKSTLVESVRQILVNAGVKELA